MGWTTPRAIRNERKRGQNYTRPRPKLYILAAFFEARCWYWLISRCVAIFDPGPEPLQAILVMAPTTSSIRATALTEANENRPRPPSLEFHSG